MQRCFCIHINYIHLEVLLFFYYKLSWEPCFMKLLEHPIVLHNCLWQNIIDVPVCEIEPRRQLFPSGWEQRLYKFCFIWVEEYVG